MNAVMNLPGFVKCGEFLDYAEELLTSQEGLFSKELVLVSRASVFVQVTLCVAVINVNFSPSVSVCSFFGTDFLYFEMSSVPHAP